MKKYKEPNQFENNKIARLNRFFMRNVLSGLLFTLFLFLLTTSMILIIILYIDVDEAVKISIISMGATYILTTSKTMIDRVIEITSYTIRLLGEEQRGFTKKIGVEVDEVEFKELDDNDQNNSLFD